MSRIFDQDFADSEPYITKHPERLIYGWSGFIYYALVMALSGFVFAIAVFGG